MAKLRTVSCLGMMLALAGAMPLRARSFSTRFDKNSSSDSILIHRFSVTLARAARGLESFLELSEGNRCNQEFRGSLGKCYNQGTNLLGISLLVLDDVERMHG